MDSSSLSIEAYHKELHLPEAPQGGQESSKESHSEWELDGSGSVTHVCVTTLERSAVGHTEDGAVQRRPAQIRLQAAAGVQLQPPSSAEHCKDRKQMMSKYAAQFYLLPKTAPAVLFHKPSGKRFLK